MCTEVPMLHSIILLTGLNLYHARAPFVYNVCLLHFPNPGHCNAALTHRCLEDFFKLRREWIRLRRGSSNQEDGILRQVPEIRRKADAQATLSASSDLAYGYRAKRSRKKSAKQANQVHWIPRRRLSGRVKQLHDYLQCKTPVHVLTICAEPPTD